MAQADRCQDPEHQAERLPEGQLTSLPHHVHGKKRTYDRPAMPCQSTHWSDPDTLFLPLTVHTIHPVTPVPSSQSHLPEVEAQ